MIKAVRHFGIVVSDIEESLHFYRELLGLKVQKDRLEEGEFIDNISGLKNVKVRTIKMSADDGNLIELLFYHSHKRHGQRKDIYEIGPSHPAFTVENIDQEYNKLMGEGVEFNSPPQASPDRKAKVAFCHDPDGILVELVEELNKN